LGVQALDDAALQFLGRLHDINSALAALDIAQSHFPRVSFDLIYARPHQSPAEWRAELARALSFGTSHLSLYQLTIEAGTQFATMVRMKKFTPLDDDAAGDLFALTRDMTQAAGLPAYEISNHAKLGEASRHNLTYWRYQDYVGIGPGAHGRRNGMATIRHKKPENWLESVAKHGHGISECHPLALNEQASEALLMSLRLAEGVDISALAARFALPETALINRAKRDFYTEQGLLTHTKNRLIVTDQGMPLLDGLLGELIPTELVTPSSPLPFSGGATPSSPLPFRGEAGGGVSQTAAISQSNTTQPT
jgi:oxygen-independent coproporphyrinogen-3 oxidase